MADTWKGLLDISLQVSQTEIAVLWLALVVHVQDHNRTFYCTACEKHDVIFLLNENAVHSKVNYNGKPHSHPTRY